VIQPTARAEPSFAEIEANPIVPANGRKHTGKVTLAFDLSSSCCGWAVGQDETLERYGKFIFKSTAGTSEKLAAFAGLVDVLLATFQPNEVILENPLSGRAKVTARHFELVGILRATVYARLGYEIEQEHFISPKTVKKWMEVPSGTDHNNNKLIMVNKINDLFGLQLKYDPNSKIHTDDDTADAIAALVAWYRRAGTE
jgi:Holliday junction resolvasome RuvABC endonuclease subunit